MLTVQQSRLARLNACVGIIRALWLLLDSLMNGESVKAQQACNAHSEMNISDL